MNKKIQFEIKEDDLDKVSGGQEINVREIEYGDFHCQNCYYVMGSIAEVNEGDVCPQCGHVQTFKNFNEGGSGGNWIVC